MIGLTLRRRGAATITLLAAAAMAIGAHLWFETRLIAEGNAVHVTVAQDAAGVIADQTVRLVSAVADEAGLEHPAGTATVTVRFALEPGSEASACRPITLSERDGARRTWDEQTSSATDGTMTDRTTCDVDTQPYDVHAVFIVPEDADGPYVVEFRDRSWSHVLRFDVDLG